MAQLWRAGALLAFELSLNPLNTGLVLQIFNYGLESLLIRSPLLCMAAESASLYYLHTFKIYLFKARAVVAERCGGGGVVAEERRNERKRWRDDHTVQRLKCDHRSDLQRKT